MNSNNLVRKLGSLALLQLALASLCGAAYCQSTRETPSMSHFPMLHVDIKPKVVSKHSTVAVQVTLKNDAKASFEFIVVDQKKPYTESLVGAAGMDLFESRYPIRPKDRSTPGSTVKIPAGTQVVYRSTIEMSTALPKNATVGTYRFVVTFPITRFIDGKYDVELLKSQPVDVTVTE